MSLEWAALPLFIPSNFKKIKIVGERSLVFGPFSFSKNRLHLNEEPFSLLFRVAIFFAVIVFCQIAFLLPTYWYLRIKQKTVVVPPIPKLSCKLYSRSS